MAVYTEVDEETLKRFLATYYDIGGLQTFAGIAEGIENTNYSLHTDKGQFILTLFEKRTPEPDLPFFMSLMAHLAGKSFPCPLPVAARNGNPLQTLKEKKAAIVTFVPGRAEMAPQPDHCRACGEIMARMHRLLADFDETRPNPLGLDGCREILEKIKGATDKEWPGLKNEIDKEFSFLQHEEDADLPTGIIHADLFPDNVHFKGTSVTGVIDFYFACTDALSYDLAVTANSWCFDEKGGFRADCFAALMKGYESIRQLTGEEKGALPLLLRRASLRFLLTRAQDWLFPPEGVLGVTKDPMEHLKILSFHRKRRHIGDYLE